MSYAAVETTNLVGKPIDFGRLDTMKSESRMPYHFSGSQISDDRRVQGIVTYFGRVKTRGQCLLSSMQLLAFVREVWPVGCRPTKKLAKDFHAITELPPQDVIQLFVAHICQQWLSLAQTIINTVFQSREADRNEPICPDQIAIVSKRHIGLYFEIYDPNIGPKLPASLSRVNNWRLT